MPLPHHHLAHMLTHSVDLLTPADIQVDRPHPQATEVQRMLHQVLTLLQRPTIFLLATVVHRRTHIPVHHHTSADNRQSIRSMPRKKKDIKH